MTTTLKSAAQQALEALDTLYRTLTPETLLAKSLKQRADTLRAALAEPVQEPVACLIGVKGSAFDLPDTKRAYTYAEQPGNVAASKIGSACSEAFQRLHGDFIDLGLSLLQCLQEEGFGVFDLGAEYNTPPQRKPLTDEEISKVAAPFYGVQGFRVEAFARAIEAAHGIGSKT